MCRGVVWLTCGLSFALIIMRFPGGSAGWLRGCPESVLLYLAPRARCAGALYQDTVFCTCIVCRYFTTGDTRTVENSSLTSRVTPEHLLFISQVTKVAILVAFCEPTRANTPQRAGRRSSSFLRLWTIRGTTDISWTNSTKKYTLHRRLVGAGNCALPALRSRRDLKT